MPIEDAGRLSTGGGGEGNNSVTPVHSADVLFYSTLSWIIKHDLFKSFFYLFLLNLDLFLNLICMFLASHQSQNIQWVLWMISYEGHWAWHE